MDKPGTSARLAGRLRPRFEEERGLARETLVREAAQRLGQPGCPFAGAVLEDHLWLSLPKASRRLWSPVLELRLTEQGGRLRISGQFGPDPGAWTFFLALYAFTMLCAGLALLWGSSVWMLGGRPTILWVLPAAGALLALLHYIARRGQAATAHQMADLRHCVGELLDELEQQAPRTGRGA